MKRHRCPPGGDRVYFCGIGTILIIHCLDPDEGQSQLDLGTFCMWFDDQSPSHLNVSIEGKRNDHRPTSNWLT